MNRNLFRAVIPAALVVLTLAACGGQNQAAAENPTTVPGGDATQTALSGEVLIDGSSTVGPLTSAAGELFKQTQPDVNVSVGISGTGGGFEVFCQGQTDISDASRPIKDEEAQACADAGIEYTELQVATDALTVCLLYTSDAADE